MPTRSKKQCGERWQSKLDPSNKIEWTKEEDWVVVLKRREIEKRL